MGFTPPARPGLRPSASALAIGVLVLLPFVLFLPALLGHKIIYGIDLAALGLPFRAEIQRCLAAGQWPLWMPSLFCGMPGIAACNLTFLYPSDLLANVLGWTAGHQFGIDAALHLALAGLGMYLFLRRLSRSVEASFLGALFFALSGSQLSPLLGGFYNLLQGVALLPWIFWAAHKGCTERSWPAWGACGLAFGLQILAVATQLFAYCAPVVAIGVLVFVLSRRKERESPALASAGRRISGQAPPLLGLGFALGLAFLLSAPQVWPTAQYLALSNRQSGTYAQFASGSIHLSEALTWFVPGLFGWDSRSYLGSRPYCYTTEYLGLLPWALAFGAVAALWRREAWVRRFCALGLAALLLAQRDFTPWYGLIQRLPVYSGFGTWTRILVLATVAVCALAAYGVDALAEPALRSRVLRAAGLLALLVLATALWTLWVAAPAATLAGRPADAGPLPPPADLRAILRASALLSLALAAATLPVLWLGSRRHGPALLLPLVLVLHLTDESQVYQRFVRFMDAPSLEQPVTPIPLPPPPGPQEEPWRVLGPYDDAFPNLLLLRGYENLSGAESMRLAATEGMVRALKGRSLDWASLFNARYIVLPNAAGRLPASDGARVFGNPNAFPRAWLVGRSRYAPDLGSALGLLASRSFNPRLEAALDQDCGLRGPPPKGAVRWLDRSPLSEELSVSTDRPSALIVSDAWYPSWRCAVDGKDTPVLRADGGLRAVLLQPGRHRLAFRFDTGLFHGALAACLAGLLALLAVLLAGLRPPLRRGRP